MNRFLINPDLTTISIVCKYGYDKLYQLSSESRKVGSAAAVVTSWDYDDAGNNGKKVANSETECYIYDSVDCIAEFDGEGDLQGVGRNSV